MSSRTKLIAIAVVAVMLPTTVLSVIQYRSLHELERQTRVAAQENLRQAALTLAGRIEQHFRELAGQVLSGTTEEEFQKAVAASPAVDAGFMVSDCGCEKADATAVIWDRSGIRRAVSRSDHEFEHLHSLFSRARMLAQERTKEHDGYIFAFAPACPEPAGENSSGFHAYVFSTTGDASGGHGGFKGVRVKSTYMVNDFLPNVLSKAVDSSLAFGIFDQDRQLVYAKGRQPTSYPFQTTLEPVFPQWQVAVAFPDMSIEEFARTNFRRNMILSAFVLSLLVAGIVLTLRATAREMRLAEVKSAFVSNVSHELKTPLALIRLFAETLELGRVTTPEKRQEYYRIINNESCRLTQLINNILDFSKIEAGRKEYDFESADVGQVVEEVMRTYEHPIRKEGFDVGVRIEPAIPASRIDRGAISQAVLNLLNNAVKYSDAVKQIDVAVRRDGGHVAIEVADKGIGIGSSEQHRIFEKFYRISNGLVHDRKGTGLGLTLVKHIVDAHSGTIRVDSVPGQGSRFTILLPLLTDPRTEVPAMAYEGVDR